MTISIAGNPLKPNLSYLDILNKIKDLITANWVETNPPLDDGSRILGVTINFDWYDGNGEYQITLRSPVTNVEPENLGWTFMRNDMFVDLHLWVKQLTELHPQKYANCVKQLEAIFDDHKDGLASSGISYMFMSGMQDIIEEDATTTVWHCVINLQLLFRRVET